MPLMIENGKFEVDIACDFPSITQWQWQSLSGSSGTLSAAN